MSKLKDALRKAIGNGSLTSGLSKITIDELIEQYGGIVTINGIDIVEFGDTRFPVFTFEEDETRYFSGGKALRDMVDNLIEIYDGDFNAVNVALREEPARIRLNKVKTKSNRTFTTVALLKDNPQDPPIDPDTGEILGG